VYFDQIEVQVPVIRQHGEAINAALHATFQGCQDQGICYPPITRTLAVMLPAVTHPLPHPSPASGGGAFDASPDNPHRSTPPIPAASAFNLAELLLTLSLALTGGLVLNLMPCVLPVLSLKVLGLARSGESRAHARRSALWYSAGVLTTFGAVGLLVISLRSGGQALGWGFQLQQPWFVAALAYVMFAVGLSLSGVFTLSSGFNHVGQTLAAKAGPLGDFFTGALACVVASPCIAPFMGGALAYALTAPPPLALLVFLTLGLGLALPFVLIAYIPALAGRLPKPGAWMETLKQFLAFPMYLTALWLLWVLGRQRGLDIMMLTAVGMLVLVLALWLHERGRWQAWWLTRSLKLPLLLLVLALTPIGYLTPEQNPQLAELSRVTITHEPYDPIRLQALRDEGRMVFVNMTADWCVTCKLNEARVLGRAAQNIIHPVAGKTHQDVLGASGEPVHVVQRARAQPLRVHPGAQGGEVDQRWY